MRSELVEEISQLKLGEIQQHENMVIVALELRREGKTQYITLKEALERNLLKITEISNSGSVPQLKVSNDSSSPVLLLDGEELAGAKQNRVLNTTVLLKEKSETLIPVSCTEAGRWSYTSREFHDSEVILPPVLRSRKSEHVTASLVMGRGFMSDQAALWQGVDSLSDAAECHSPTAAMRDVYVSERRSLSEYSDSFQPHEHQNGFICFVDARPVGMELLSLSSAFRQLFPKLIQSYAMDAMLSRQKNMRRPTTAEAGNFLKLVTSTEERKHPSVGYGFDLRFNSNAVVGSALIYEDDIIHMAFFRRISSGEEENMASSRRRRRYRL